MKRNREWLIITSITASGAIIGFAAYSIVSYLTGSEFVSENLVSTIVYTSIAGLLVSGLVTMKRNKHDT